MILLEISYQPVPNLWDDTIRESSVNTLSYLRLEQQNHQQIGNFGLAASQMLTQNCFLVYYSILHQILSSLELSIAFNLTQHMCLFVVRNNTLTIISQAFWRISYTANNIDHCWFFHYCTPLLHIPVVS